MATLACRNEMQLAGNELVGLADIRGTRLRCLEGSVWLTLDRDLRDVVLAPGDSFVVDRDGVTLLHALAPARLEVASMCAVGASRRGVAARLVAWLRRRRAMAGLSGTVPAGG